MDDRTNFLDGNINYLNIKPMLRTVRQSYLGEQAVYTATQTVNRARQIIHTTRQTTYKARNIV